MLVRTIGQTLVDVREDQDYLALLVCRHNVVVHQSVVKLSIQLGQYIIAWTTES